MAEGKGRRSEEQPDRPAEQADERTDDPQFEELLQQLVDAYRPLLEARYDAAALENLPEAEAGAEADEAACEREFETALQFVESFHDEQFALKVLPPAAVELLGPIERWRWCLFHSRACVLFGLLICRGLLSFPQLVYYLRRYWLLVRSGHDETVLDRPLTPEERKDFTDLTRALSEAYREFLKDEMTAAESADDVVGAVFAGQIDCFRAEQQTGALFDRFLTAEASRALLGPAAYAEVVRSPFFWYCRCWCICAIRFGCCLARANSLADLVRCLRAYVRCLEACARPLRCNLTAPTGCAFGNPNILPGRLLEPVIGSAYGLEFDHYTLEVRDSGGDLLPGVVVYRDGGGNPDPSLTQGAFPVGFGTLGWIDLGKAATAAGIDLLTLPQFEITLQVFGTNVTLFPPCKTTFSLSLNKTQIRRVSTPWSVDFTDPTEPLRKANDVTSDLATVGGTLHVRGAADVFGCAGEKIAEYTIWAIADPTFSFPQPVTNTSVTPGGTWVQLTHIEYSAQTIGSLSYTADQVRALNRLDGDPQPDILTNQWGSKQNCITLDGLPPICYPVPALIPQAFNSNGLSPMNPVHEGGTGKFTVLLQLIDTSGNTYYDVQRVWVDNEPIKGDITGIGGLPACTDLYTRTSAGAFKTVSIEGTAWDQLIEPGNLTQPTSDNFDQYRLRFQKQGAAGYVSIASSTSPVPPRPQPLGVGTLGLWNLQSVDAASNPTTSADQLLKDGESCTYNVVLEVWDKTVVNEGTVHQTGLVLFPIKIINSNEP